MEEDIVKAMLEYRAKHSMSQGEFAKICNLTKATVWNVEAGKRKPTPLTRTKINLVLKGEKENG